MVGGSVIQTSRAALIDPNAPASNDRAINVLRLLKELEIGAVLGIGGDDTLTSLNRLALAAKEMAFGKLGILHLPKTIDNDLPLPDGMNTFGFSTAADHAAYDLNTYAQDAHDTRNTFFVIIMMGRYTGHLAVEAARRVPKFAEYSERPSELPLVLIPEMFPRKVSSEEFSAVLQQAVQSRIARGRNDGVIVVAEGVFEALTDEARDSLAPGLERDAHQHAKLADVPLESAFERMLAKNRELRATGVKFHRDMVGFNLRAIPPNDDDQDYTKLLGKSAVAAALKGMSEVTVLINGNTTEFLPFASSVGPNGRVKRRSVNVDRAQDVLSETMEIVARVCA